MPQKLLIKNGLLILPSGAKKADILISGGKIAKVASRIRASASAKNIKTIEATGLAIFPGLVDCHVHFRDPGHTHKEDFYTGTAAALAGGVTTVIDMPNNNPPTTTLESLEQKQKIAAQKAVCDYSFQFGATNENFSQASEAGKNPQVSALKLFYGSSTGNLLVNNEDDVFWHFKRFNQKKPVCIHAEDEEAIRHKMQAYKNRIPQGHHEIHGLIRNETSIQTATRQVLETALRAKRKIHLCHISTQGELKEIAHFRKKGVHASCEVTPHHLFLSRQKIDELENFAKANPAARGDEKTQGLLIEALEKGAIDCVSSDHAPHLKLEKQQGYWNAPSGVPGVETLLPLMLSCVARKKISLKTIARACSLNPAQIFNLKNKGEIAVGKDADLVLVDLSEHHAITAKSLHSKCAWTPFEGFQATGKIKCVFLRGKIAFDGEKICLKPGDGKPTQAIV